MAYAAVISLRHTLQRLLKSHETSILPLSRQIIEHAYEEARSLQGILQRLEGRSNERVNALNKQIRETIYKLEDALEANASNQFLSQFRSPGDEACPPMCPQDLEEVKQEINYFIEMVKRMEDELRKQDLEFINPFLEETDDVSNICTTVSGGIKSNMVGLHDERHEIRQLITDKRPSRLRHYSLVGMPGIGKSTLAKEIYEDALVSSCFKCRAWVTIGPKYDFKKILLCLLGQMNYNICDIAEEDEKSVNYLRRSLKGIRYFIVLDDIWSKQDWDKLKSLLPDGRYGSRVLLTTTVREVAEYADMRGVHQMRFLNETESWLLLCQNVFGDQECPSELKSAGKKIAENCEGLPLAIVIVARLLREKSQGYWMNAAQGGSHIFKDANAKMSKMLFWRYKYLPENLKTFFLYLASFPVHSDIPASKLINLWNVEGFLEESPSGSLEDSAMEYLKGLVSRSLVLVSQQTSMSGIKTCRLHSALWHLCVRVAEEENFFHVISSYSDSFKESIKGQRRLCIHKNILFGIAEVRNSIKDVTSVHSLLCTGPYHQYPVPILSSFGFWMLRVLDALTIHLHNFPIEVLKLVQLKYLSLTCNEKLPPSICKLSKLQYLIVHQYLIIKSSTARSYLPMEIWDMQELKHLQITGGNLPNPCGASLPNLVTLSGMSVQSCTREILEAIPNLKKLGIQIDIDSDNVEPLSCFDHLSLLHGLESLKFVIVNPNPSSQVISPPASTTIFPSRLKKIILSGFGYSWESMRIIAELPNLEVLKLQFYAFQGPEWVVSRGQFLRLRYLLLEDNDLVHWRVKGYSFPFLQCLIIRYCYNLENIPLALAPTMIELVDCPLAEDSAKQIQKGYGFPEICFRHSWKDA